MEIYCLMFTVYNAIEFAIQLYKSMQVDIWALESFIINSTERIVNNFQIAWHSFPVSTLFHPNANAVQMVSLCVCFAYQI